MAGRIWFLPEWFYHVLMPLNWYIRIPPWNVWLFGWHIANWGDWWSFHLDFGWWLLRQLVQVLGLINSTADYLDNFIRAARTIAEHALYTVNDWYTGLPGVWRDLLALPFRLWEDINRWWANKWNFIEAWFIIRRWEMRQLWERFTRDYVDPVSNALNAAKAVLGSRIDAVDDAWKIAVNPLTVFTNAYRSKVVTLFAYPFDFVLDKFVTPAAAQFRAGFEEGLGLGTYPDPGGGGDAPPDIIEYAMQFVGRRYVWGGNGPDVFDCSGYVKYVWAHFGLILPRTCQLQFEASWSTPPDVAGDLVFFQFEDEVDHVGLYTGSGDTMIHASSRNGYVKVDTITALGWWPFYKGIRRP